MMPDTNPLQSLKHKARNFLERIYYRSTRARPSQAPDPNHTPGGRRAIIRPQDDAETRQSLMRENESADTLARAGYRVEQRPMVPGSKKPDYRIENRIFDNYAPFTGNPRNIWSGVEYKVSDNQADRVVINLDNSPVAMEALKQQFNDWPIAGLKEIIVVKEDTIIPFWP